MRRSPGLAVLSRRELFAVAGCAGLFLVGCTDSASGGVETGPLNGDPNNGDVPDAPSSGGHDAAVADAHQPPHDSTVTQPDASAGGPACTGTATDVGAASAFTTGTPVYVSSGKFFVVRDAGGLFAVTALCTHEGATCAVSSGEYRCPRHGALFQFDGTIISGPVSRPLGHFAMCILSNGHVGVTKTTCTSTQRLEA